MLFRSGPGRLRHRLHHPGPQADDLRLVQAPPDAALPQGARAVPVRGAARHHRVRLSRLRSAFKAANIHATQTYIDLAGNECDIRTGLPIGSLRIAKDQDIPSKNQCYGTSGYSFYGDDDGHDSEEYIEYNPREGVGKMVFVREYD